MFIVYNVDKQCKLKDYVLKLTTKTRYGTRAVLDIALNFNEKKITRKHISKNQDIPISYLENILIALKSTGLIKTKRGPGGGFELAKKPENITMLEIYEVFEGPVAPVECLKNADYCSKSSECITKWVWDKLGKAQEAALKEITVQDLIDQTRNQYQIDFSI